MLDSISIVVPVYNCEKYIGKCIKSIQKQTYQNWKLILVDDGSTDGSAVICDKFAAKDSRIAVIHQENGGALNARLTGITKANSEFLAFVDADDLVEAEMFQRLVDIQVQYSADIVSCGHKSLSQRGLIKSIGRKTDTIIHTSGKEEAIRLASGMPAVSITLWGKLFRKNLFLKAQNEINLFSDIFVGDDHAINTAVFDKADKVVIISDKLYLYRTGGGITKRNRESNAGFVRAIYIFRKNYLLKENAPKEYHKSNLAQILNVAVCLAHYSEEILRREMICSKLENVIEDMNTLFPEYRYKNAYDLNISMTDWEFKKLYHESAITRIKQILLKIL